VPTLMLRASEAEHSLPMRCALTTRDARTWAATLKKEDAASRACCRQCRFYESSRQRMVVPFGRMKHVVTVSLVLVGRCNAEG
jgi:hypothetical protein